MKNVHLSLVANPRKNGAPSRWIYENLEHHPPPFTEKTTKRILTAGPRRIQKKGGGCTHKCLATNKHKNYEMTGFAKKPLQSIPPFEKSFRQAQSHESLGMFRDIGESEINLSANTDASLRSNYFKSAQYSLCRSCAVSATSSV